VNIDGKTIGNKEAYLIAEIGVNYFDIAEKRDIKPLEAAKKMVKKAKESGADAVKFQSYKAEKLAAENSPAYWDTDEEETESQYELFKEYDDFGEEEFRDIADYSEEIGIDFLSTPFHKGAVDYLEDLVPAYKVASADITNLPLLKHIASKGKPIFLSTGASNIGEIDQAIRTIEEVNSDIKIAVLHCVLQYPTDEDKANLNMIKHLQEVFPQHTAGYSDHVPPDESMMTLINSWMKGAKVIEKHFTLDKTLEGNDHYHAMNPGDIKKFRKNTSRVNKTSGKNFKEPLDVEQDSRKHARRSLVAKEKIKEGEKLKKDKISVKRPGTGISPKYLEKIEGIKSETKIQKGQIISWKNLK
jgi:N-acetylneuraminate synthase